jgi:flagellar motor switch protein FliN/FliY
VADPQEKNDQGFDPNSTTNKPHAAKAADVVTSNSDVQATNEDRLNANDIEQLLDQATASLQQATGEDSSPKSEAQPYTLGDLKPTADEQQRHPIELLGEVEMDLRIELGRTLMRLDEVLQLRSGSVVALDKLAGDPVDVFVNGRLIARGEVLVMNDNFCIRVTELVGV